MKRSVMINVLVCFGVFCGLVIAHAAETSKIQEAEQLLIDKQYAEAFTILQELRKTPTEKQDYLLFLTGNALFYQKRYEQAITLYAQLIAQYPESVWMRKAVFKQAECALQLKQFEQAETIYEREVVRLVSPERKERMAEIYLQFAKEYFTGKGAERAGEQQAEQPPDYARAKTFYELALQMEISKAKAEFVRFQIARCAFELQDFYTAGQMFLQLQQDYPEGTYRTQALLYLGKAYLQQNQLIQARQVFRDLFENAPDDPSASEAAFLLSRTYHIPTPYSVEDLELGVSALQEFLELYGDDPRVFQAEYEIGMAYYNFGRHEESLAALTAYIKKYETLPVLSQEGIFLDGLPLARYYVGQIYQQQRKYAEAIAVWKEYLQKHPSHNRWSDVQRQILDTEYLIADKLFLEKQYAAARAAWEQFLNDHPLDQRNPDIMFRIGETFVKEAEESETGNTGNAASETLAVQQAIAQWKRTVSKYPETESASRAQYEIGRLLETKLLKFAEALEAYQQVNGAYYYEAQQRIQEMRAKRLTVLTERVFRTNETPTLKITTRNIPALTFKMYKVDLETYFRKMQTTAGVDSLDIALIDPDLTWQEPIADYEKYREFEQPVAMQFTEPGAYLVTCSEETVTGDLGYEATTFVLISDVDILVKTTKRDLLVFAQNMKTGGVYPDVKFYVSDGKKIVFEGTTGRDGVFHGALDDLKEMEDVRVFAHDATHYAATTLFTGDMQYVVGLEARGYIYTDRPAYRPGQQVGIRGIIRGVEEREYRLQVMSSQGGVVYQGSVSLNEFGSFAADVPLSANTPIGEYRIVVNRGKYTFNGAFLVEQYQLEKIKLTIETDREVYFRGETIKGVIKAEYYYGEPVKTKHVTYTLAGVESFTGITDEQGAIAFTLDTRNFAESQTLTLTARLDDENVQTGKTVWLATRGFVCDVKTIRIVYLVNENIEVNFAVKDPTGKPLQEKLRFGVFKRETTPYGDAAEVKVLEQEVLTAEDGTAKTMVQIADGGSYVLRADGRDRFGNPVSGQAELFISGNEDEIKLRIITDQEEFKVGDTPEITVFSRASEGLGLLTYEAETILSYQILALHDGQNPLALSITSAHAPNFTLTVAQMDRNKFHQAEKEFAVVQGLNIAIQVKPTPNPSQEGNVYQPGETISVEITTTDHNGLPMSAEVSLAMVDEALYAQYAERVPPIRTYFYDQRRGLLAKIGTSCTFQFAAETQEILEELTMEEKRVAEEADESIMYESSKEARFGYDQLGALADLKVAAPATSALLPAPEPQLLKRREAMAGEAAAGEFLTALREYFPETGYWNPSIVTDQNGKAVITVQLPDSTTNWRFTSRGITKETLVGETTAGIVTKLPFFVELKTPSVLTEGDTATILASVHNYSGQAQSVQATFTGTMETNVLERQEQQIAVEDNSVQEAEYRLDLSGIAKFDTLAPIALEFAAATNPPLTPPRRGEDRIKRKVPVRPWGIEYVTTTSGTLRDDTAFTISLPGDHAYLYREMQMLLNPSVNRTLIDLTNDIPWIEKAPASSVIHEALVVLNALTFLKASDDPVVKTLQARFAGLLTEIALTQNADGGWAWTGRQKQSDPFVSADAVTLLARANRLGYPLPDGGLPSGIIFLKQAFQAAEENEMKVYLLYALAVAGDLDFAHVNRVYRERNALNTSGLALLTLIYTEINRPEIAAELLQLLQSRAKTLRDPATGAATMYWPSDSQYPWLQGDVDTTAWALFAAQKAEPTSTLIPAGIEWLNTQRQWIGWGSMRTNARVSAVLLEHFTRTQFAVDRYRLTVAVNGASIRTLDVERNQSFLTLQIPAELLKDYENTVDFTFDGRGSLNYVAVLKGISRDVRKTQNYYEVWRYYEPAPLTFQGQEIRRGFSVLDGSYSTWRNAITQIPLGGFGRVTLQYHRRDYAEHQPYRNQRLILEEPLPSGCTVLTQSLQGNVLDYTIEAGKIVFYLDDSRYGTITYDLYGYLPGAYRVLPTKVQSPYQPQMLDYGEPYNITVLTRGQAVTEQYRKTPDELYYYGKALFDAKQYADARSALEALFTQYRLRPEPYKETARMLMYIAIADRNARDIVQYFEVLKEKYPNLVMAFDDIIAVGQAYRDIGEHERAVQVFKATAEASFLKDVQVSGALEAQGEFAASVEHTRNTIFEYPDVPTTETAFYALGQLLYTEAENGSPASRWPSPGGDTEATIGSAGVSPAANAGRMPAILTKEELLKQTLAMFTQFLILYPENPMTDEVSFSLANAYLDLEDFGAVIQVVQRFQQRYPTSSYLSGYQYMEGYANFELERYDKALELCQTVATRKYPDKQGNLVDSDHKDLAIYIMGQIYHSMGQPEQAIAEYEKVKDLYPDAQEAITHFTQKRLTLEEVTTFTSGVQPQIMLHYRNVKDVLLLVYRVDLMKLYLLEKNLNTITGVNLAGITPYHQTTLTLGDGKDYADKEQSVPLPLEKEGAYLVVAKEAELDASGMVLVSALQMDVDEDAFSGRVRVNVMNAASGRYENNVHVKVIGSGDDKFVSGETDLRGIFIADNLHGAATVIARKGDQYAFYRGETQLQPPAATIQMPMAQTGEDMRFQATEQLRETNTAIQQQSADFLRQNLYQNKQEGVEVQAAY